MSDTTRRPPIASDQLTVDEYARRMGVSVKTIRVLIARGSLDVVRTKAGRIRIRESARPTLSPTAPTPQRKIRTTEDGAFASSELATRS